MSKKLDLLANVAIIILAVLISVSLFSKRVHRTEASENTVGSDPAFAQGERVSPPEGYRWEEHNRTLLMALRYGCAHCERNMQLYRELQDKFGKGGVKTELLSVFPDDSYVAQHDIDTHGLHGLPFLANVDFAKLHLPGTPTLLWVDNRGAILRSWVGELSKEKQDEVLQAIQ